MSKNSCSNVGCVANFAQEVMKGQLSRLVGGLRGQGVEQFGRSEAFVSGPNYQLFLLDHVHEFDPNGFVKLLTWLPDP